MILLYFINHSTGKKWPIALLENQYLAQHVMACFHSLANTLNFELWIDEEPTKTEILLFYEKSK